MGLIRKSMSVSTLGVVKGSSKKQRVARQTQRNTKDSTLAARSANNLLEQQLRQQAATAQAEHEYRYATDETYREYTDAQAAAAAQARQLEQDRLALRRQQSRERRAQVLGQVAAAALVVGGLAVQVLSVVMLVAITVLLGVAVWAPQALAGAVRHTTWSPWQRDRLRAGWQAALSRR